MKFKSETMDKLTQINKAERELHAAKGRLRELKQSRWIDTNYRTKPVDQAAIQQTEQKIKTYRQTLAELYKTI